MKWRRQVKEGFGSIANIYDSKFQFTKTTTFLSFELLVIKSMQPTQSLFIATVHRPPGPYTAFLIEFLIGPCR
jgi:hypothetical protein